MKTIIITLALLAGVAYGGVAPTTAAADASATRVVVFDMSGMMTPNCPVLVKKAVGKMEGVESVKASLEKKTATVTYVVGVTTPAAIAKVIEDRTGFKARPRS